PRTTTIDLNKSGGAPRTDSWPSDANGIGLAVAGLSPDGGILAMQELNGITVRAMDRNGTVVTLTTLHGAYDESTPQVALDLADSAPVDSAAPTWAPGRPCWVSGGLLLAAGLVIGLVAL